MKHVFSHIKNNNNTSAKFIRIMRYLFLFVFSLLIFSINNSRVEALEPSQRLHGNFSSNYISTTDTNKKFFYSFSDSHTMRNFFIDATYEGNITESTYCSEPCTDYQDLLVLQLDVPTRVSDRYINIGTFTIDTTDQVHVNNWNVAQEMSITTYTEALTADTFSDYFNQGLMYDSNIVYTQSGSLWDSRWEQVSAIHYDDSTTFASLKCDETVTIDLLLTYNMDPNKAPSPYVIKTGSYSYAYVITISTDIGTSIPNYGGDYVPDLFSLPDAVVINTKWIFDNFSPSYNRVTTLVIDLYDNLLSIDNFNLGTVRVERDTNYTHSNQVLIASYPLYWYTRYDEYKINGSAINSYYQGGSSMTTSYYYGSCPSNITSTYCIHFVNPNVDSGTNVQIESIRYLGYTTYTIGSGYYRRPLPLSNAQINGVSASQGVSDAKHLYEYDVYTHGVGSIPIFESYIDANAPTYQHDIASISTLPLRVQVLIESTTAFSAGSLIIGLSTSSDISTGIVFQQVCNYSSVNSISCLYTPDYNSAGTIYIFLQAITNNAGITFNDPLYRYNLLNWIMIGSTTIEMAELGVSSVSGESTSWNSSRIVNFKVNDYSLLNYNEAFKCDTSLGWHLWEEYDEVNGYDCYYDASHTPNSSITSATIQVRDVNGNIYSRNVNVYVDTTKPTVTTTYTTRNSTTFAGSFTISDTGSGFSARTYNLKLYQYVGLGFSTTGTLIDQSKQCSSSAGTSITCSFSYNVDGTKAGYYLLIDNLSDNVGNFVDLTGSSVTANSKTYTSPNRPTMVISGVTYFVVAQTLKIHEIQGTSNTWTKQDRSITIVLNDYSLTRLSAYPSFSCNGGVSWQYDNICTYTDSVSTTNIIVKNDQSNQIRQDNVSIKVDKGAPNLSLSANTVDIYGGEVDTYVFDTWVYDYGNVLVIIDIEDTMSGISSVTYTDSPDTNTVNNINSSSKHLEYLISSDGTHRVVVLVTDNAGNVKEEEVIVKIHYNLSMNVTFMSTTTTAYNPMPSAIRYNNVYVKVDVTGSLITPDSLYMLSSANVFNQNAYVNTTLDRLLPIGIPQYFDLYGNANTAHIYIENFIDPISGKEVSAGTNQVTTNLQSCWDDGTNCTSYTSINFARYSLSVDTEPPTIVVSAQAYDEYDNLMGDYIFETPTNAARVVISAYYDGGDNTGCSLFRYSTDGINYQTNSCDLPIEIMVTSEFTTPIFIELTDGVGNVGYFEKDVIIDRTAPIMTMQGKEISQNDSSYVNIANSLSWYKKTGVHVRIKCEDDRKCSKIFYSTNNGQSYVSYDVSNQASLTPGVVVQLNPADTTLYNFKAYVQDIAGNISTVISKDILVDLVAPHLIVTGEVIDITNTRVRGYGLGTWENLNGAAIKGIRLTLTCSDDSTLNCTNYKYTVYSAAGTINNSGTSVIIEEDGETNVTFMAKDLAGNEASITQTVRIDTSAPILNIGLPVGNISGSGTSTVYNVKPNATVGVSFEDTTSGLKYYSSEGYYRYMWSDNSNITNITSSWETFGTNRTSSLVFNTITAPSRKGVKYLFIEGNVTNLALTYMSNDTNINGVTHTSSDIRVFKFIIDGTPVSYNYTIRNNTTISVDISDGTSGSGFALDTGTSIIMGLHESSNFAFTSLYNPIECSLNLTNSTTYCTYDASGMITGVYYLYVQRIVDKAGNFPTGQTVTLSDGRQISFVRGVQIAIESDAPSISVYSKVFDDPDSEYVDITNRSSYSEPVDADIKIVCSSELGCVEVYYTLNGTTRRVDLSDSVQYAIINLRSSNETTYTLSVYCVSRGGARSQTKTLTITINDITPPSISASGKIIEVNEMGYMSIVGNYTLDTWKALNTSNQSISVSYTCSGGCEVQRFRVKNPLSSTFSAWSNATTVSVSSYGITTIEINAADTAGNSVTVTKYVKIDELNPTLNVIAKILDSSNLEIGDYVFNNPTNQNVKLTATCTSQSSCSIKYSYDSGTSWSNYSTPLVIEDAKTVTIKVTNQGGGETINSYVVNIDKTPPSFTGFVAKVIEVNNTTGTITNQDYIFDNWISISNLNNDTIYSYIEVSFSYSNDVVKYGYIITNSLDPNFIEGKENEETSFRITKYGVSTIVFYIEDAAGNSVTVTRYVQIDDLNIPLISVVGKTINGDGDETGDYTFGEWVNSSVKVTISCISYAGCIGLVYAEGEVVNGEQNGTLYTGPIHFEVETMGVKDTIISIGTSSASRPYITYEYAIKIDKEPPSVSYNSETQMVIITEGGSGIDTTINSTLFVGLATSTDFTSFAYTKECSITNLYSVSCNLDYASLSAGTYYLYHGSLQDKVGNSLLATTPNTSIVVNVDTEPPVVQVFAKSENWDDSMYQNITNLNTWHINSGADIKITCSAVFSCAEIVYIIDGSEVRISASGNYYEYIETFSPAHQSIHAFEFYVVASSGMTSDRVTITLIINDTTPPVPYLNVATLNSSLNTLETVELSNNAVLSLDDNVNKMLKIALTCYDDIKNTISSCYINRLVLSYMENGQFVEISNRSDETDTFNMYGNYKLVVEVMDEVGNSLTQTYYFSVYGMEISVSFGSAILNEHLVYDNDPVVTIKVTEYSLIGSAISFKYGYSLDVIKTLTKGYEYCSDSACIYEFKIDYGEQLKSYRLGDTLDILLQSEIIGAYGSKSLGVTPYDIVNINSVDYNHYKFDYYGKANEMDIRVIDVVGNDITSDAYDGTNTLNITPFSRLNVTYYNRTNDIRIDQDTSYYSIARHNEGFIRVPYTSASNNYVNFMTDYIDSTIDRIMVDYKYDYDCDKTYIRHKGIFVDESYISFEFTININKDFTTYYPELSRDNTSFIVLEGLSDVTSANSDDRYVLKGEGLDATVVYNYSDSSSIETNQTMEFSFLGQKFDIYNSKDIKYSKSGKNYALFKVNLHSFEMDRLEEYRYGTYSGYVPYSPLGSIYGESREISSVIGYKSTNIITGENIKPLPINTTNNRRVELDVISRDDEVVYKGGTEINNLYTIINNNPSKTFIRFAIKDIKSVEEALGLIVNVYINDSVLDSYLYEYTKEIVQVGNEYEIAYSIIVNKLINHASYKTNLANDLRFEIVCDNDLVNASNYIINDLTSYDSYKTTYSTNLVYKIYVANSNADYNISSWQFIEVYLPQLEKEGPTAKYNNGDQTIYLSVNEDLVIEFNKYNNGTSYIPNSISIVACANSCVETPVTSLGANYYITVTTNTYIYFKVNIGDHDNFNSIHITNKYYMSNTYEDFDLVTNSKKINVLPTNCIPYQTLVQVKNGYFNEEDRIYYLDEDFEMTIYDITLTSSGNLVQGNDIVTYTKNKLTNDEGIIYGTDYGMIFMDYYTAKSVDSGIGDALGTISSSIRYKIRKNVSDDIFFVGSIEDEMIYKSEIDTNFGLIDNAINPDMQDGIYIGKYNHFALGLEQDYADIYMQGIKVMIFVCNQANLIDVSGCTMIEGNYIGYDKNGIKLYKYFDYIIGEDLAPGTYYIYIPGYYGAKDGVGQTRLYNNYKGDKNVYTNALKQSYNSTFYDFMVYPLHVIDDVITSIVKDNNTTIAFNNNDNLVLNNDSIDETNYNIKVRLESKYITKMGMASEYNLFTNYWIGDTDDYEISCTFTLGTIDCLIKIPRVYRDKDNSLSLEISYETIVSSKTIINVNLSFSDDNLKYNNISEISVPLPTYKESSEIPAENQPKKYTIDFVEGVYVVVVNSCKDGVCRISDIVKEIDPNASVSGRINEYESKYYLFYLDTDKGRVLIPILYLNNAPKVSSSNSGNVGVSVTLNKGETIENQAMSFRSVDGSEVSVETLITKDGAKVNYIDTNSVGYYNIRYVARDSRGRTTIINNSYHVVDNNNEDVVIINNEVKETVVSEKVIKTTNVENNSSEKVEVKENNINNPKVDMILNKKTKIKGYKKKKSKKVNKFNRFSFKLFSKYFFKIYDG